jgi:tetratricopeptide (TPR) repeat protein
VLERGAVEGEIFHRGAVQALAPDETQVTPRLAALVRKELIRPDRTQLAGDDGFRFRHLLIRDAAYEALPKAVRADLHERFAAWMEEHGIELVELDEILGYHLEQACRYHAELGTTPYNDELAAAARRRLTAAGRRAQLRSDYAAAVSLLERASARVPTAEIDLALENKLVDSLFWGGRGDEALRRADALAERAAAAGDPVGELCGRIQAGIIRTSLEPEGATEKLDALVQQALPVFDAAGDNLALYTAYQALGQVANTRGQMDAALEAYERAAGHARQAGLPDELLAWRSVFLLYGTRPLSDLLAWLDENEPREPLNYWLRARRAAALAMLGRFDRARAILAGTRAELAERGAGLKLAAMCIDSAAVELWAGDPAAAAKLGADACGLLDDLGEKTMLSNAAGTLAQALYALDRLDEADVWAGRAAELGASDDAFTQLLWRQVRAKLLARRGQHEEAERLAGESVAIGEETDMLDAQGDAYSDLGEVLVLVGKPGDAATALEQALERYKLKGNIVSTQRARSRLAEIRAAARASST